MAEMISCSSKVQNRTLGRRDPPKPKPRLLFQRPVKAQTTLSLRRLKALPGTTRSLPRLSPILGKSSFWPPTRLLKKRKIVTLSLTKDPDQQVSRRKLSFLTCNLALLSRLTNGPNLPSSRQRSSSWTSLATFLSRLTSKLSRERKRIELQLEKKEILI